MRRMVWRCHESGFTGFYICQPKTNLPFCCSNRFHRVRFNGIIWFIQLIFDSYHSEKHTYEMYEEDFWRFTSFAHARRKKWLDSVQWLM